MNEARIVRCPECSVRLKIPLSKERARCPKCQSKFNVASTEATKQPVSTAVPQSRGDINSRRSDPATSRQFSNQPAKTPLQPSVGFIGFVAGYFRATRGSFILWSIVVVLVCFIASFLKPVIGYTSIVMGGLGFAAFAVLALGFFFLGRFTDYFFRGNKQLPERPKSRMAPFGFGGGLVAVGLGMLAGAECFSPEEGLVAANISPVAQFQLEMTQAIEKSFGTLDDAGDKVSLNAGGESEDSMPTSGSVIPTNQDESSVQAADFLPPLDSSSSASRSSPGTENGPPVNRDQVSYDDSKTAENSSAQNLAAIESALGLGNQKTSELIVTDQICEPGGTFSEKLRVGKGVRLWGGENIAPPPGGAF